MELIDKAALVAEIEKRKTNIKEYCVREGHDRRFDVVPEQLAQILSFLDTLEVKEVDLEKSISDWLSEGLPNNEEKIDYIKETAEHFFELGLRYNSSYVSIPNIDDTLKEIGVNPDSKAAKSFKESYYMALENFKEKKG